MPRTTSWCDDMRSKQDIPIRRRVYVRAYISLLTDALQAAAVDDRDAAADALRELRAMQPGIHRRPEPPGADYEFMALISTSHTLLGLKGTPFMSANLEAALCAH